jgi:DNA mismatch endonuclease (patch repair protein)
VSWWWYRRYGSYPSSADRGEFDPVSATAELAGSVAEGPCNSRTVGAISCIYAKVRGTHPEIVLRRASIGALYYAHYRQAPGTPDLAIPAKRLAVFVDGDLWHGHPERRIPDYWRRKIDINRDHDAWVNYLLERDGWTVVRLWERDIRRNLDECVEKITRSLTAGT